MYIINCTKQTFIFCYREPRRKDLWNVQVASGQQELFGLPDWSREEWGFVIKQLEVYGIRQRSSVSGDLRGFSGLLYDESVHADADDIQTGHVVLVGDQEQRSVENATRAAIGFGKFARDGRGKPGARSAEVEVIEQPDPYDKHPGAPVNMSIAVDPEGRSDMVLPGVPRAA